MDKEDARKLSPSAQEEKRKLAIKLWQQGHSQKYVAEAVGTTAPTMSGWVKRFKSEGHVSLKANKRGPKSGQGRHLTAEQEVSLQRMIKDQSPDQLKLSYVLWTRKAVMELIQQETDLKMPIRTVGEYLKRWGFTPQKPLKQAYEQNPKAVQQWLDEDYRRSEKTQRSTGEMRPG